LITNNTKSFIKKPKNIKTQESLIALTLIYAAIVLTVQLSIMYIISLVLTKTQILDIFGAINVSGSITIIIISSIVTGYVISFFILRLLLKPLRKLVNCMNQIASGNYKERIQFHGPISNYPAFIELSNSINTMADELEHTEILNNDFVNNFSHEFKTPIASIAGFAKLLKYENLSEEDRKEYLSIIEEEAMRLSKLTNNTLEMIKLENQTTLTGTSRFNLSEQLRNCIILMADKWQEKNINLQLDFNEYEVWANEDLLKQVWINLLDNAIKFTPENETITIEITKNNQQIITSITNTGSEIPEEAQKRIFNKFYQADESHSAKGNGIGLAVVKRIITLHKGEVSVFSENNNTTFTISIPA